MGQTQKVEVTRTCDSCGKSVVLIQGQISHDQLEAASGWYLVNKEHLVGVDQLLPIAKLACSKGCALNLLNSDALELPEQPKSNVLEFGKVN